MARCQRRPAEATSSRLAQRGGNVRGPRGARSGDWNFDLRLRDLQEEEPELRSLPGMVMAPEVREERDPGKEHRSIMNWTRGTSSASPRRSEETMGSERSKTRASRGTRPRSARSAIRVDPQAEDKSSSERMVIAEVREERDPGEPGLHPSL